MPAPEWAVGMRRIGPGLYVDEAKNEIHVNGAEICEALGAPPTQDNIRVAENAALAAVRKAYPGIPVTDLTVQDL